MFRPEPLPDIIVEPIVRAALAEDLGRGGDVTSDSCIPAGATFDGVFRFRKAGVLAGLDCARLAIGLLDPQARFETLSADGAAIAVGEVVATVHGRARAVLAAERVALNLLQRLSGVATTTASYVQAVEGTKARITDTRKTTPLLRALEKYAVRCGGGLSHRSGLDDAILIKDNHIAACGGIKAALTAAKAARGHLMAVEIEVDSLDQFDEVLSVGGADVVLLDNFTLDDLREAVRRTEGRFRLEASGGVTLQTVMAIAQTGVNAISVGALTHSSPALDVGLDADS